MGRRLINYSVAFGYRSSWYIAKEKIEQYEEIYLAFVAYFGESATFEEAVQACLESV